MAEVKLADVAKLRKATGAGMMDCKKALEEAAGNFDRAVELIRERGKAIANKRADRDASEGVVLAGISADGKSAAMLALNCETDFVAKNEDFITLAQSILDEALKANVENLEALLAHTFNGKSVEALVLEQSGVTGEKMELSYYQRIKAESVSSYIHPGNKLAAILGASKAEADKQLLRDIAMQIAGMNPIAVDAESIPEEVRKKEFEIGREQARLEGKPEQILDKIAEGRLQKFVKENTLMGQEFVKEGKVSVEQYISKHDKDLKITEFARFTLMG